MTNRSGDINIEKVARHPVGQPFLGIFKKSLIFTQKTDNYFCQRFIKV